MPCSRSADIQQCCIGQARQNKYVSNNLFKFALPKPATKTSTTEMRVLISGAGVAGPSLAYFLSRAGARVTVVERAPELLASGQNIDVQGSALTAIKRMGLFDELRKLNTTELGTRFVEADDKPYASFPFLQGGRASPTNEFEILRGDLAKMIYKATEKDTNVQYRFGTTVDEVVANDQDGVRVRIGQSKEEEEYDVLVAADGQWSRIRKACFPADDVQVVDKDLFIAYFTIPRQPTDDSWWDIFIGTHSRLGFLRPDPHGTMRASLLLMPTSSQQRQEWQKVARGGREAQMALTRSSFADMGWKTDRFLREMTTSDDFYLQSVQQIRMKSWFNNRVVCVGDAAYAPTPLTGSGATLAITGAYILAGELAKVSSAKHPTDALRAYEQVFKPFVEKKQNLPGFIPGAFYPDKAWHRMLLKTGLSTTSRLTSLFRSRSTQTKDFVPGAESEKDDDGFPLPNYPGL